MNGKDAEALPWMAGFTRDPWPMKIVWRQDDITHERFYWLKIPDKSATILNGREILKTTVPRTAAATAVLILP